MDSRDRRLSAVLVCMAMGLAVTAAPANENKPVRLTVSGTPAEMGRQVGARLGPAIRRLHPTFLATAVALAGQSREALYAKSAQFGQLLCTEDVEELKGLAEGAGMSYQDVLFLNCFYTLTSDRPFCRQLAVWGQASADGELLHARNLDWADYPGQPLRKNNLILNLKPKDGQEYLIVTWPGLMGVLTGTSAKGITVGFNRLAPGKDQPLGEPIFFTLKRALRTCGSVEEVVELIRKARPFGNGSVMVSDAIRKRAVVAEVVNGQVGVRGGRGELIANANHCTKEAGLKGVPTGPAEAPAGEAARATGPKLDAQGLQRVMAQPKVLAPFNLVSVVFAPARNKMYLSCGRFRAAEGPFTQYVLFAEK